MKTVLMILLLVPTLSFAESIQVKVKGMVCSMCAQGIQKKFNAESAVSKVNVSLEDKLVTLETKGKGDLADDKIKKIITEAGYNVAEITRQ